MEIGVIAQGRESAVAIEAAVETDKQVLLEVAAKVPWVREIYVECTIHSCILRQVLLSLTKYGEARGALDNVKNLMVISYDLVCVFMFHVHECQQYRGHCTDDNKWAPCWHISDFCKL